MVLPLGDRSERKGFCQRRLGSHEHLGDAHASNLFTEGIAADGVAVPDQVRSSCVRRKGLDSLTYSLTVSRPLHGERHYSATQYHADLERELIKSQLKLRLS